MNENDENIDSLLDAPPDVEHLRLEISENEKCFMALMALRKVPTTSSLFFL